MRTQAIRSTTSKTFASRKVEPEATGVRFLFRPRRVGMVIRQVGILTGLLLIMILPTGPLSGETDEEQEEQSNDEKWDVNSPPEETYPILLDVREGTWMSVDVSPDGSQIVFDLLGDLFVIPFEGGVATPIQTGLAWHQHPRFSPDGNRIAFTSDGGGGDNVWVMDRDGSNSRQVTEEKFRLLNSPIWTPDSQFIAARKHFTSARSLGAGEIWLYHRSGGSGLQMTVRPNDQKDLGEPAFSPCGQYLYFSLDSTPGSRFEYNKDPNPGIYSIRRLDRSSGEIETVVSGSGGAARPTPSPDGQSLAFISRVRGESVLFLKDLRSGRETLLYTGLDRDLQETWAIHGTYPGMSWTPDSQYIVFWAGGKIRRLHVETLETTEIPFHVSHTQSAIEAVRVSVDPDPGEFETRLLRWTQISPSGDRVVFQALGHLYIRDLPNGEPRRLTRQNEHFEFYPTWSRDGRQIAYTTWHDAELGSVRVISLDDNSSRVLTPDPGHYVEPVFSPDGNHIIYRAATGGGTVSPDWSMETGILEVPVTGGEPRRIHGSGTQPQFGASNDRLFLTKLDGSDKARFISLNRDGHDERTHFESGFTSDFALSPDGNWIAFGERYHAYVAPVTASGRPVPLSPDAKGIPIKIVTRDAGDYLHWSGDSQTLHWSLGQELFSHSLRDVFAFLDGAPEELPKPPTEGTRLGFPVPSDRPSGVIALRGARVVTMNDDQILESGTVLIEENRIAAVGATDQVEIPDDASIIDLEGHTILPGLIDVHWHGRQASNHMQPQQNWFNYATLAFGVTTIHDPSHHSHDVFSAAELARAGKIVAPRIFSTGTILYGAASRGMAEVESLEDARRHIRRMNALGAFSVKSYNQPRRNQRQQILTAAREFDVLVFPEGGSIWQHNMNMLHDGHNGIEHAIPLARLYDDVIQLWSQTRVAYTPTLVVAYGGRWGEEYFYNESEVWNHSLLSRFVPRTILDARARRSQTVPVDEYNHIRIAEGAAALQRAGVPVNLGAHGQREGLGVHWELWSFVQGGMSPHEAWRTGTVDAAKYLGMEAHIGTLEPGKLADLVVIHGDPIQDIRHSERTAYVMVNGRLFETKTMNQVGNHPAERTPFWFENADRETAGRSQP